MKKKNEQARQMQELQARVERLQCENDKLWNHVEKSLKLGKAVQDDDCAEHLMVHNKGKEPIISNNSDTSANDELSSRRSPSTSLLLSRNA